MRILLDSLGLQARIHNQDGTRLATFLAHIEQTPGWEALFSPQEPLSPTLLATCNILVITTRKIQDNPYTTEELAVLPAFVQRGGGLLLMTNHGDVPGRPYPNMTINDNLLAREFGIEIINSFFASTTPNKLVEISGSALHAEHPIISGAQTGQTVQILVTNNCSSLRVGAGAFPLAALPETMCDYRNGDRPQGRYFAAAAQFGKGRVVITADRFEG
jgi:hypothetical protein